MPDINLLITVWAIASLIVTGLSCGLIEEKEREIPTGIDFLTILFLSFLNWPYILGYIIVQLTKKGPSSDA